MDWFLYEYGLRLERVKVIGIGSNESDPKMFIMLHNNLQINSFLPNILFSSPPWKDHEVQKGALRKNDLFFF